MTTTNEPVIRPCKGECGHMTRPKTIAAENAPGTRRRVDSRYCSPCYDRLSPASENRRTREKQIQDREKQERISAAFKAREDLVAARQRRQADAARRAAAAAAVQAHFRAQRRVSA